MVLTDAQQRVFGLKREELAAAPFVTFNLTGF